MTTAVTRSHTVTARIDTDSTATEAAGEPDGPLTAIRQALAAAHDVSRLDIRRAVDQDTYVTITHHHDQPDEVRHATHAAYAATLQEAGWEQAFNVGLLVLIPGIPPADTEPGTHTATWAVTVDDVRDPVDAAYEARGLQHEHQITEAVWTVTDATGRRHLIITDDEVGNAEDGHGECFEPHLTADGYADCDGTPL
ncbi:hypothetical protein ACFWP3_37730 [Streptomyces sp. NPDC058525]|uniref:hypothetical protein n=1 Tax=Streptomyces sp. NPDC058525 TaxID=3346538 RepID=UPI003649C9BD